MKKSTLDRHSSVRKTMANRFHSLFSLVPFCLALALQSCSLGNEIQVRSGSLSLELRVEYSEGREIIVISAHNPESHAIAFSKTFGYTSGGWMTLNFVAADGRAVEFTEDVDYFGEGPSYLCLAPGASTEIRIDPLSWGVITGGSVDTEYQTGFPLLPGEYFVSADYTEPAMAKNLPCAFSNFVYPSQPVKIVISSP